MSGRLGAGGTGRLYLARAANGADVTLKVFDPILGDDAGFRAALRRQVARAGAVQSPRVAPVVDAGLDGARPWLVARYLPGVSLERLIAARGPLPEKSVRVLALGLVNAVGAVHDAGAVHGGLRPSTMILSHTGPAISGIATAWAMDTPLAERAGLTAGALRCPAPERLAGGEPDMPGDVYSLAATLVFAASGVATPGTDRVESVLYRIVHSYAVSPDLRTVLQRCLVEDPAERPTLRQIAPELAEEPPRAAIPVPALPPAPPADDRADDYTDDDTAPIPRVVVITDAEPTRPEPARVEPTAPLPVVEATRGEPSDPEPTRVDVVADLPADDAHARGGGRARRVAVVAGAAAVLLAVGAVAGWSLSARRTPAAAPAPHPASSGGTTTSATATTGTTTTVVSAKGAGCSVTSSITDSWSTGYQAQFTVTNTGTAPITGWTTALTLPARESVADWWNAAVSVTGRRLSAVNVAWDGSLAVGATTTWGAVIDGVSTPPTGLGCVAP